MILFILFFYSLFSFSSIRQEEFSLINQTLVATHENIIEQKTDHKIKLLELWNNFGGAFLIDSLRKGIGEKSLILTLTGEVPQNKATNIEGYAITACHEIGHGLGGKPKQTRSLASWSSVEGQADYYATNQCMWRFVEIFNDEPAFFLDDGTKRLCEQAYGHDVVKLKGCFRIIFGITSMQDYFNNTSSKNSPVSIFKKDATIVNKTLEKFGSNQCRLNTMMAGLFNEARPTCWFKGE